MSVHVAISEEQVAVTCYSTVGHNPCAHTEVGIMESLVVNHFIAGEDTVFNDLPVISDSCKHPVFKIAVFDNAGGELHMGKNAVAGIPCRVEVFDLSVNKFAAPQINHSIGAVYLKVINFAAAADDYSCAAFGAADRTAAGYSAVHNGLSTVGYILSNNR